MGPIRGDTLASLRQHGVACRQAFGCEFFGTPTPSLCHPVPRRLALCIARKLGHLLAVGGVFQKFVRWIHRAVSLGGVQYNQEIGWIVPFDLIILTKPEQPGNGPRSDTL